MKIRLYADVKVSCALSGGLDSSSITYLAYQILKAILEFADEPFCDWYETQEISLPEKIILSVKTIKTYESELSEPLNKIARLAQ